MISQRFFGIDRVVFAAFLLSLAQAGIHSTHGENDSRVRAGAPPTIRNALTRDVSPPLASITVAQGDKDARGHGAVSPSVEQTEQGIRVAAEIVASFDGLGYDFTGPQGTATFRNPSDNSLAVGPDHIVQTVNSKMAVFKKKGARFNNTGKVLYGPVNTGNVFKGFGDFGDLNNGDAVVRYDQLADRWLIVMPISSLS